MIDESTWKVISAAAVVGFATLTGCSNGMNGDDAGTDVVSLDTAHTVDSASDVAIDTAIDVSRDTQMDAPTDSPIDTPVATDAPTDAPRGDAALGMCEVSAAVAAHTAQMATMGWSAVNHDNGLLMYGCTAGSPATSCLATAPLADATNIGANVSSLAAQHLRILYSSTNSSAYWTRISPDGRFIGRGTHVRDMVRSVDVEAGPVAMYDPAFFPDGSQFMYQPNGRTCPLSVLTTGTPTTITFMEPGCSTTTVGLYEHLGVALGGGDYWATSAGAAAWDNGGHSPTLHDPPPNSPWRSGAQTTLTLMANTGTTFTSVTSVNIPTPYQGDGVISPSSTLFMTRVADVATGQLQVGYRLHRLTATRVGSAVMASLTPIANYCFVGAKPAFSLDERWVAMHHYVTDDDAVDLGFTGPSDPAFAAYQTQGAANVYLVDLATGNRTRLTNMAPGQYALYPAFRSDGWIYFNVRTLGSSVERIVASDAALVMP